MDVILPSEATPAAPLRQPWSPLHQRLQDGLLRPPPLLPAGARLLLAVSGGQDSMALTRLLQDLQRLHHWELHLWHGDHGWRAESAQQAAELQAWAQAQGLPLLLERAPTPPKGASSEAEARAWRYGRLSAAAQKLGCRHVVTGHTTTDRAETLLLQLARGSHRAGLTALRRRRPLSPDGEILLLRPLLGFSRGDTAAVCQTWQLPVWADPSNQEARFSRNRIRQEVLPVLEELYPGATGRISALMQRLEEEQPPEAETELEQLALRALERPLPSGGTGLNRPQLNQLAIANRRRLLHRWIQQQTGLGLASQQLEQLIRRLAPHCGPGQMDLRGHQQLTWNRELLSLHSTPPR